MPGNHYLPFFLSPRASWHMRAPKPARRHRPGCCLIKAMLFALPGGNDALASKLAETLGYELGQLEFRRFTSTLVRRNLGHG
jgi:hypothetical protein